MQKLVLIGLFALASFVVPAARGHECTESWVAVDTSQPGTGDPFSGTVHVIAKYGSSEYVGGEFSWIGGAGSDNIARYDRTTGTWYTLSGGGTNGPVYALAEYDGKLIVGGDFTLAGGVAVNGVASREIDPVFGVVWSSMESGVFGNGDLEPGWDGPTQPGIVFALEVFQGELYVGGAFTSVGDNQAVDTYGLASWNGTAWSAVGSGLMWKSAGSGSNANEYAMGRVYALDASESRLYIGGKFIALRDPVAPDQIGDRVCNVAIWDGAAFTRTSGGVFSSRDNVGGLVGCEFGDVSSVRALHLWDTNRTSIATDDRDMRLYVGGDFEVAGLSEEVKGLAEYDLAARRWRDLGLEWGAGTVPVVRAIESVGEGPDAPYLLVGGTGVGRDDGIVTLWNGSAWEYATVGGANKAVHAIYWSHDESSSNQIFLGGDFECLDGDNQCTPGTAGMVVSRGFAKWCRPDDADDDGAPDAVDNCSCPSGTPGCSPSDHLPNGPLLSTCLVGDVYPVPATCSAHADCDNPDGSGNGICGLNQFDADGDGFGDACDDCRIGDDTADFDADGIPDACDPCPATVACGDVAPVLRLTSVVDQAGASTETYDYSGSNTIVRTLIDPYASGGATPIMTVTYDLTGSNDTVAEFDEQPLDGTGSTRTTTSVFDEAAYPGRRIGVVGGSGCGCSDGERLAFRDHLYRTTRRCVSDLDPLNCKGTEQITYMEDSDANDDYVVDDRVKEVHRLVLDPGTTVPVQAPVESRSYDAGPEEAHIATVCRAIDSGRYSVAELSYSGAGELLSRCVYPDAVDGSLPTSESCSAPAGSCELTVFAHSSTCLPEDGGADYCDVRRTTHPAQHADVQSFALFEEVKQVRRSFTESQSGDRIEERVETSNWSAALGAYLPAEVIEQKGTSQSPITNKTTYGYDASHRLEEIRTYDTNNLQVGYQLNKYDPLTGRLSEEIRTSARGNGTETCQSGTDAGCISTKYEYDGLGRMLRRIENFGRAGEERTTEYRYNAFGETLYTATKVDEDGGSPVYAIRGSVFNDSGQVEHEYAAEFTGDLAGFTPPGNGAAPPVLEQRYYTYNPDSGRRSSEQVVMKETIPFNFITAPQAFDVSVTAFNYDGVSGEFLLTTVDPPSISYLNDPDWILDPTTAFEYDYARRVVRRETSAFVDLTPWSGLITTTEYDGAGRMRSQTISNSTDSETFVTEYAYDADGRLESTKNPDGWYAVNEYESGAGSFGRIKARKRCSKADCTTGGSTDVAIVTDMEYEEGTSSVEREITAGVSDTITKYDEFDRVTSTRERLTGGVDDDDTDGDGVGDRVTLTAYTASGHVDRTSREFSTPGVISPGADAVTSFEYNDLGQILTTVRHRASGDPEVTTNEYDVGGRLQYQRICRDGLACSSPTPFVTEFEYDALGRVTKTIDPDGHYAEQTYNSRGLLIERIARESDHTKIQRQLWKYDSRGNVVEVVTKADASSVTVTAFADSDRVENYEYDAERRQTKRVSYNMDSADEITWTTEYDPLGRVHKEIDPFGNYVQNLYYTGTSKVEYRNTYDGLEGLHGIRSVRYGYDGLARPSYTFTEGAGAAATGTFITYDDAGRVESRLTENASQTPIDGVSFDYDLHGNRIKRTEATHASGQERVTDYAFDRLGRLTDVKAYDDSTNPPTTQTTSYEYDLLGRRTRIAYPNSGTGTPDEYDFAYDAAGRLESSSDPRAGYDVVYEYDGRGLETKRTIVGPSGRLIFQHRDYDGIGRLEAARRTGSWGGFENTSSELDTDDVFSKTTFAYNDLSDQISETQEIRYAPNGCVQGPDCDTYFDSPCTDPETCQTRTIEHGYDQAGNRLKLDCPAAGGPNAACLEFGYDELGRVVDVDRSAQQLIEYEFDHGPGASLYPSRRRITTTSGGWVDRSFEYDQLRRMSKIANRFNTSSSTDDLAVYDIMHDPRDNPDEIVAKGHPLIAGTEPPTPPEVHPSRQTDYAYDPLNRLESVTYTNRATDGETFRMDSLGNRYSEAGMPVLAGYDRDMDDDTRDGDFDIVYYPFPDPTEDSNTTANQYVSVKKGKVPKPFSYDAAGNLTQNEHDYTFEYYGEGNALGRIKDPFGTILQTYGYDALGRRIFVRDGDSDGSGDPLPATWFFYDGQRVLFETDNTGSVRRSYVDGATYIDEHAVITEYDPATGTGVDGYYLLGPLFSVAGLVDQDGNLLEGTIYDAYGLPHTTVQAVVEVPTEPIGSRYIEATVSGPDEPVALVVSGEVGEPRSECIQLYAQEPELRRTDLNGSNPSSTDCSAGASCTLFATLGPTPYYLTPAEWDRVLIYGEDILAGDFLPNESPPVVVPVSYHVQAVSESEAGMLLTDDAVVTTTYIFGDTTGEPLPPLDPTTIIDNNRVVDAFLGQYGTGVPPITLMNADLTTSLSAGAPDQNVDISDILLSADAVGGKPDPFFGDCTGQSAVDVDAGASIPVYPVYPKNPYYFTGQRLDLDIRDATGRPLLCSMHYKGRSYDPPHARFRQRDPAEYVDSMNLYEYVASSPSRYTDPMGASLFDAILDLLIYGPSNRTDSAVADVAQDIFLSGDIGANHPVVGDPNASFSDTSKAEIYRWIDESLDHLGAITFNTLEDGKHQGRITERIERELNLWRWSPKIWLRVVASAKQPNGLSEPCCFAAQLAAGMSAKSKLPLFAGVDLIVEPQAVGSVEGTWCRGSGWEATGELGAGLRAGIRAGVSHERLPVQAFVEGGAASRTTIRFSPGGRRSLNFKWFIFARGVTVVETGWKKWDYRGERAYRYGDDIPF